MNHGLDGACSTATGSTSVDRVEDGHEGPGHAQFQWVLTVKPGDRPGAGLLSTESKMQPQIAGKSTSP